MAYGTILGQTPTASNVSYNNASTSSIITGTNVQQAIDQLFTSVSNGKQQIASAITDKGVSTSASDSFATMAENIGKIVSGIDISLFNQEPTRLQELTGTIPLNSIWIICGFVAGSNAQVSYTFLMPVLKARITCNVGNPYSPFLMPVYLETNKDSVNVSYATDYQSVTVNFNTGEYVANYSPYGFQNYNMLYTS